MNFELKNFVKSHQNFPKEGIIFRDILPLLQNPIGFNQVIESMSNSSIFKKAEAIIAIDARGFIFGTAISIKLSKPMIVARKPGKLPGLLISKSYDLEYGKNSLSVQKEALENFESYAIVDDLLATGGTVKCVYDLAMEANKKITGLSVVIELKDLKAKEKLPFKVESHITY